MEAGLTDEARVPAGGQSGGEYCVPASRCGRLGDRKGMVLGKEEFDLVDAELEDCEERMEYDRGEEGGCDAGLLLLLGRHDARLGELAVVL